MVNKSILDYMPKQQRKAATKRTREQADADNDGQDKTEDAPQEQKDLPNKPDESNDDDKLPPRKRAKTDAPADDAANGDDGVKSLTTGTSAATPTPIVPPPASSEKEQTESTPAPTAAKDPITFENFESLLDPSWQSAIGPEFKKPYFLSLKKFLVDEAKQGQTIFPPVEDVFNAFRLCKYDQVKVVLIGQDPYIQKGQAHGLCFSVISADVARPPSLK